MEPKYYQWKYLVIEIVKDVVDRATLKRYNGQTVYTTYNTKKEAQDFVKHEKERLAKINEYWSMKTSFKIVRVKTYEKQ